MSPQDHDTESACMNVGGGTLREQWGQDRGTPQGAAPTPGGTEAGTDGKAKGGHGGSGPPGTRGSGLQTAWAHPGRDSAALVSLTHTDTLAPGALCSDGAICPHAPDPSPSTAARAARAASPRSERPHHGCVRSTPRTALILALTQVHEQEFRDFRMLRLLTSFYSLVFSF